MPPIFASQHGANVNQTGSSEVSWVINRYDGLCVLDKTMTTGDVIDLKVECLSGGGHALIGITTENTYKIKANIKDGTRLDGEMMNIGLYLNETSIKLEMKSKTEIIQTFQGKDKTIHIVAGSNYRFSVNIMFGKLTVTILQDGKSRKFNWDSNLCGANVRRSPDKRSVSLMNDNPHSQCALKDPLREGETIGFDVTPNVSSKWHYLKLYITSTKPRDSMISQNNFKFQDDGDFVPMVKIKNPRDQVLLTLQKHGITCKVGKVNPNVIEKNVIANKPIYLYFELIRVSLKIQGTVYDDVEPPYTTLCDASRDTRGVRPEPSEGNEHVYEQIGILDTVLEVRKKGEAGRKATPALNILEKIEKSVRDNSGNKALKGTKYTMKKNDEIYQYLAKFGHDLKKVDSTYLPDDNYLLPIAPPLPHGRPSTPGGDSCTNNNCPAKPAYYLKDSNEDLINNIGQLKKRVSEYEKKNINANIVVSVNLNI